MSLLKNFCFFCTISIDFNILIDNIFEWIYTIYIQIFSQKFFLLNNFKTLIPSLFNSFALINFLLINIFRIWLLTVFILNSIILRFISNSARSIIFVMDILRGWFCFHQFWNRNHNILRGTLRDAKLTYHQLPYLLRRGIQLAVVFAILIDWNIFLIHVLICGILLFQFSFLC